MSPLRDAVSSAEDTVRWCGYKKDTRTAGSQRLIACCVVFCFVLFAGRFCYGSNRVKDHHLDQDEGHIAIFAIDQEIGERERERERAREREERSHVHSGWTFLRSLSGPAFGGCSQLGLTL